MPRLINMWKRSTKHKKLADGWDLAINQDFDGEENITSVSSASYKVKYLGHVPVELTTNTEETTNRAVDSIISMSKVKKNKSEKVVVTVTLRGVEVIDHQNTHTLLDLSIFRIRNCMVTAKSKRIFALLATDAQNITECHAFSCPKRNVATVLALTVAQVFTCVNNMCQAEKSVVNSQNTFQVSQSAGVMNKEENKFALTSSIPRPSNRNNWKNDENCFESSPFQLRPLAYAEVYNPPSTFQNAANNDVRHNSVELIAL